MPQWSLLISTEEVRKMSNSNLLTIEALCEKLHVSRNTAYRLLAAQIIPAFKVGRAWRIPVSSVEEFIADQINAKEERSNEDKRNGI